MTSLTLLRTLSLGYFAQHRVRMALVVLSIALGVATLVATQGLARGLGTGIQDGLNPLGDLADVQVESGHTGVPGELAATIRALGIAGIDDARAIVLTRLSLTDLDNKVCWLIGLEHRPQDGSADRLLTEDNPLGVQARITWKPKTFADFRQVLTAPLALVTENIAGPLRERDAKKNTFEINNAGRKPRLTVAGTLDFRDSKLPLKSSAVIATDLATASHIAFPDHPGQVHRIAVKLTATADREAVLEALRDRLGDRYTVQTVEASRQMVSDVTAGLEIGLAIGGAGALVVGLFLVYNALSVSVAERRHDIGILRSVGATRDQIARLFFGEATLMGLVGSILGLPLGWLLAWLAVKPLAGLITELLVPIDEAAIRLPGWLMACAIAAGTAVAQAAASIPALHAANEEPADAVRRVPRKHPILMDILQIASTVGLLAAGMVFASYRHHLPPRVGMFAGIVCLLLGGLVLTPILAHLVGRIVQPLFRHLLGLEGRLAADNLVRAPGRTGIVIAALAATGALMVQTAGFLKSTREAIRDWVDEQVAADLFVTSGSAVTSGGSALSMRDEMRSKLQSLPEVATVLPVRFHQLEYRGKGDTQERMVFVIALDSAAFAQARTARALARNLAAVPQLREPGKILVSDNFAALYKIKVGEKITLKAPGQPVEAEVIGTVTDYTWNRGTIIMDLGWYRQVYGNREVSVFDVFLKEGADLEAVREKILSRWGNDETLFVASRPEVHDEVQKTLTRVYAVAYAQQGVVGLVALLGVVSSLFISVLQRRRELGLLRAVGASRSQILRSVLAEAVLMGVIGAVVGFGIGLLLEWYVLDIMILDEAGFSFPMRIPWLEAGAVALVSVLLATLAGLAPAYQATQLRIPEAIAYE